VKKATWPGAGIHTPASLARTNRRLDRKCRDVDFVVGRMRAGQVLRLCFTRRKAEWFLSPSGELVTEEIARLVISRPDIVDVGDALFAGATAQTFRYIAD